MELYPKTGRRHQLRYHMKHLSHPMIGDPKYGKQVHNTLFKTHFQSRRLLLASRTLAFEHPFTEAAVTIHCPLAADFRRLLGCLGWGDIVFEVSG